MKLIITDIEDFKISIEGEHKIIKPNGSIHNCIGCFGCWVKTPGKCVIHDDMRAPASAWASVKNLFLSVSAATVASAPL